MVRNLATNYVGSQFHVAFDEKFFTIQNDTRLEDTTVGSIFKDLFTDYHDYLGKDGRPPDGTIVPEGGTAVDPSPKLWE